MLGMQTICFVLYTQTTFGVIRLLQQGLGECAPLFFFYILFFNHDIAKSGLLIQLPLLNYMFRVRQVDVKIAAPSFLEQRYGLIHPWDSNFVQSNFNLVLY